MPTTTDRIPDQWDDATARGLSEPDLLLYRSNLLGSDLRITNYGGGNTSAKVQMADPLTGEPVDVLWVKGSGGDLGSMRLDGFATLYLSKVHDLRQRYRGLAHEDEMVDRFTHCTFNLNPRATSIDTPLHALVPHRHIDHMHADAIIAIAASRHGERLAREIFGGELGWVGWQRPGFDLGLKVGAIADQGPSLSGLVMGSHGLMTWGDTSKACYATTIRIVRQAAEWLDAHGRPDPFGPTIAPALPPADRRAIVAAIAPELRRALSPRLHKVMHYLDTPEVLEFVGRARCAELSALGTTCPDHFLRTKVRPLVVPFTPGTENAADIVKRIDPLVERYASDYAAYYERCKRPDSPKMRDPYPVLILIPGVGLLAFQRDKQTARVAADYWVNAVNVIRWAEGVDEYAPIPEQDAFDIEYWLLEEAKLQRLPRPKPLEGRVAFVTGGGGGIGGAVARRFLDEGAAVVVNDIDQAALDAAAGQLTTAYGQDRVRAVRGDVTSEAAVAHAFAWAVTEYGGVDILVSNAGIASASPFEETSLAVWQRNIDVLATGYFLVSRSAFAVMKRQGLGGAIVYVASKNALVASAGAAAYCAAKAAEVHLARCLALEGAESGIRVNVVNPDAVIQGSRIWGGTWRAERAASNNVSENEIEEFYRKRSLLKRNVVPDDVAEAVLFFASDRSAKSTGNIINVDAGNVTAFAR